MVRDLLTSLLLAAGSYGYAQDLRIRGERLEITTAHYTDVAFSAWSNTGKTFRVGDIAYYFERTLNTTGTYYQVPLPPRRVPGAAYG